VDSVGKDWVILDVGGVGYEVHCPSRTLGRLPEPGKPATLTIETHVREDAIRLFGFLTDAERSWFRLLQNVQGVGTKVALSVLGVLEPQELANAISLQDKAQVARAPGVGPKVAQRIVSELRDKAPGLLAGGEIGAKIVGGGVSYEASPVADAISALVNLGYAMSDAGMAVASAAEKLGKDAKTEALIRQGLKELAR
jgi:Holliday junction DNA helicase RuvA